MADTIEQKPTEDDWRRGLSDPAFFASRFLKLELHRGQIKWLKRSHKRENLLVTGNRWGKSFVSAIKLIHHAIYRYRPIKFDKSGRYRAVVASITQNQANIVFSRMVGLIRQSNIIAPLLEKITWTPFPMLEFGNGSTVEARSTQNRGEYLLGNDYDLFIFDEVAFEMNPEYLVEEVILMRLADREGSLDLVSTPNGKNWFYQRAAEIKAGKQKGYLQSGDSRDNPHISADYLDERIRYFSDSRRQQNIMGQFVDSGGEILRGSYIDRAIKSSESGQESKAESYYISGWDLARKQTATVGITLEVSGRQTRVVSLERFKWFDWVVIIDKIKQRQLDYPGRLIVDATGLGDVVVEQLREFKPEAVIFSPSTKVELLSNVELIHARGGISYDRWELPDGPGRIWSLEDELRAARWDNNNRYDSLMALALALWPLRKMSIPMLPPRVGKV